MIPTEIAKSVMLGETLRLLRSQQLHLHDMFSENEINVICNYIRGNPLREVYILNSASKELTDSYHWKEIEKNLLTPVKVFEERNGLYFMRDKDGYSFCKIDTFYFIHPERLNDFFANYKEG